MNPLISLIVPVYNAKKYLAECINSLINQTLTDIEIIIIDDGSSDGSAQLCDVLGSKDSRIVVVHQKNQGVSVARNQGILFAKGKWISFIDADDWVAPSFCEIAVEKAESCGADVLLFAYYSCYANQQVYSKLTDLDPGDITDYKDYLLKKTISQYYGGHILNNGVSAGTTWGKILKKDLIDKYGLLFTEGLTRAQDTVFWLRGFEYSSKIYSIDEPLYYYRINEDSVCSSSKYLPNCSIPFEKLLKEYQLFIDEFDKDDSFIDAYRLRVLQVMLWYIKHHFFHEDNPQRANYRIKELKRLSEMEPYQSSLRLVKIRWLPKGLIVLTVFCRLRLYVVYYPVYRIIYSNKNRETV